MQISSTSVYDYTMSRSHDNVIIPQAGALKKTDMKLTDQVSRHEIDGHENAGRFRCL